MTQTKTCRKCGKELPATLEFFYKNSGGKYGLTPRCKPCVDEDNQIAYQKRMANNREKVLAQNNARSKKHYHANLEAMRDKHRNDQARRRADPVQSQIIKARKRANGAGLKPEEIDQIFLSQGQCCAICKSTEPGSKAGWNLDHCHETETVRFILCAHCNRGLGAFRDNPDLMRQAADMLEAFQKSRSGKDS